MGQALDSDLCSLSAVLVLTIVVMVCGAESRGQAPTAAPASAAPTLDIEHQPYRISIHLSCEPSARFDVARRDQLVREWQALARRFVGSPWIVSIAPADDQLSCQAVETVYPEQFQSAGAFDIVWLIQLSGSERGAGLELKGRAYDAATRRIGPLRRGTIEAIADAPRDLFIFTQGLFSPTALVKGQEGGRALLTVRGAAIAPATPVGAVVSAGTIFQPLRLISTREGTIKVSKIDHTYLRVESIEGAVARCGIVTALKDPLTQRLNRPFTMAAIGVKPGNVPTRLRFQVRSDRMVARGTVAVPELDPAAGYTLTSRLVPDGQPRDVGLTDRAGRIVLKPGFADGLVILRLLAGNVEPMVELPLMPGESDEELSIPFPPKPLTLALEAQLDSLSDEVVDLIALRGALERRMKARLEGEDWEGLGDTIKEFAKLPPRDAFAKRLTQLKEDAAKRQAETKKPVLTPTAQAQINDLQNMIDRYLDDDSYNAYVESLDRAIKEGADKAKEKENQKEKAAKAAMPPPPVIPKDIPQALPKNAVPPAPAAKPARPQPKPSDMPF